METWGIVVIIGAIIIVIGCWVWKQWCVPEKILWQGRIGLVLDRAGNPHWFPPERSLILHPAEQVAGFVVSGLLIPPVEIIMTHREGNASEMYIRMQASGQVVWLYLPEPVSSADAQSLEIVIRLPQGNRLTYTVRWQGLDATV